MNKGRTMNPGTIEMISRAEIAKNLKAEHRERQRAEYLATAESLNRAAAKAEEQGFEVYRNDNGKVETARDGFAWLCGSSKRTSKLTIAQRIAGERYRTTEGKARPLRITPRYGEMTAPSPEADGEFKRWRKAVDEHARATKALGDAHPRLLIVTEQVVLNAMTISAVAKRQGREDAAVLDNLIMALDILARHYGYAA